MNAVGFSMLTTALLATPVWGDVVRPEEGTGCDYGWPTSSAKGATG